MLVILLLVLGSYSANSRTVEYVDMIELNWFHDSKGKLSFCQLVFWRFRPTDGKPQVITWTMCDQHCKEPVHFPNGMTRVEWDDSGIKRDIQSRIFRESWTHFDVERENLKVWPQENRVGLAKKPEDKTE